MEGRHVEFHDGHTGIVKEAVGLISRDNVIYAYAVHVLPNSGRPSCFPRAIPSTANGPSPSCQTRQCPKRNAPACRNWGVNAGGKMHRFSGTKIHQ